MPVSEPFMPPGTTITYYHPRQAWKVTIQTDNGVLSVLEVPEGVYLSVQASEAQNPISEGSTDIHGAYQGDIVIRTCRVDETQENESLDEKMAKSPLEMSLKNATVIVEVLGNEQ